MHPIQERLEQLAQSSETKVTKLDYADEELTEEEKNEALRSAREQKFLQRKKNEYFDAIRKQPVFVQYTALDLYKSLKATKSMAGKRYVVDDQNLEQIKQLCFYFANDDRFNGSLNLGLCLMGKLGTGKTHLMAFFQQNQHASFSVVKTRTVENAWINEKEDQDPKVIDYYSWNRTLATNENMFGHKTAGFCFDDLGSESQPSKRYGEAKNVMAEVIMNRYDNKLPFNTTHITTNLNSEEIEKLYGSRVVERLAEMMNVIVFEGESRR